MNDDRKFQERAEMMKKLLEAQIPTVIVAEVVNVHESTAIADRKKIEKQFSIKLPKPKSKEEFYSEMLQIFAKGKVSREKDILYSAAGKIIAYKSFSTAFANMYLLLQKLYFPQREQQSSERFIPYEKLLNAIFPGYLQGSKAELEQMETDFWSAIAKGEINISQVKKDEDVVLLISEYLADVDRDMITSLSLDEEEIIADIQEALEVLPERDREIVRYFFGLDCDQKSPEEIGKEMGFTREWVRVIKEKSLRRLRRYNYDSQVLLRHIKSQSTIEFFTRKTETLEKELERRDELREKLLIQRNAEDDPSRKEEIEEVRSSVLFLVKKLNDFPLSVRVKNVCECAEIEYLYQIIEYWESLLKYRNFGKKSIEELRKFFNENGLDPESIDKETLKLCEEYINQ